MKKENKNSESLPDDLVSMDFLEKIADAHAFELMGENIGRGAPVSLSDTTGLYGLSPDGKGVFRYDGAWNAPNKWTGIGGPAGKIFAGGNGRLFITNPQTKELMSYE